MSETIFRGLLPDGTLPTEARADVLQIINDDAYLVVGTGRPDVPAGTPYTASELNAMPVGTRYRSTDGPQGAWKWRKTGATSWVCAEGNTGWRQLPPVAGFTTGIRMCRTASGVRVTGRLSPAAETVGTSRASFTLLDPVPSGFMFDSPAESYLQHGVAHIGAVAVGVLSGLLSGNRLSVTALSGTWGAGDVLILKGDWLGAPDWPTALPGTAA